MHLQKMTSWTFVTFVSDSLHRKSDVKSQSMKKRLNVESLVTRRPLGGKGGRQITIVYSSRDVRGTKSFWVVTFRGCNFWDTVIRGRNVGGRYSKALWGDPVSSQCAQVIFCRLAGIII